MKNFLTIVTLAIMVLTVLGLSADDAEVFDAKLSLKEYAFVKGVPVSEFVKHIEAGDKIDINMPMQKANITKATVDKAEKSFYAQKFLFAGKIVVLGMLVVFLSLMVTGFIIHQLRHLALLEKKPKVKIKKEPKSTEIKTPLGTIKTDEPDVSTNSVVAVVTALHKYLVEVEEEQKMLLTWKRTPLSMWKAQNITSMPNREFMYNKRS